MSGYNDILRILADLETEDRLNHERNVLQSRLTPLHSKCYLLKTAGFTAMAERHQRRADMIRVAAR
jgi:hypothetical protein